MGSIDTCPVCGRPGTCCQEVDRLREGWNTDVDWANKLLRERDVARSALRDILDEVSNGVTANWDYIAKRFAEGLGDTNVSV